MFKSIKPNEHGNEILHLSKSGKLIRAQPKNFHRNRNVLFVHGFSAGGKYMEELLADFRENDFEIFIYSYSAFRGIKSNSEILCELLKSLDQIGGGVICENRILLVAHSLGGLVSRSLYQFSDAQKYIKGLVTLGTPNKGALFDSRLVELIVRFGENISENLLVGFNSECEAIKELLRHDFPDPILDKLQSGCGLLDSIPTLSLSAGRNWLDFGSNELFNYFANKIVQSGFHDRTNDGLVLEENSSFESLSEMEGLNTKHLNDYREYSETNHNSLVRNQSISLMVIKWALELQKECVEGW